MRWTKPQMREDGTTSYLRLVKPGSPVEEFLLDKVTDVVVLVQAYCECSVLQAFEEGRIVMFGDMDNVEKWSTSELSDDGTGWAKNVFTEHYAPLVRTLESESKVIHFDLISCTI